jgi:hypothetical protein
VASGSVVGAAKRQKLMRVGSVADLGSGVRLGGGETGVGQLFKIPELPIKHAAKPKSKGKEKADVFGDVEEVTRVGVESKSKGKKKAEDSLNNEDAAAVSERANKNVSPWPLPSPPSFQLTTSSAHQESDDSLSSTNERPNTGQRPNRQTTPRV